MKWSTILALGAAASAPAFASPLRQRSDPQKFLVEFSPGKSQWVTEDEKWELKLNGKQFIDITNEHEEGFVPGTAAKQAPVKYPSTMSQQSKVNPMIADLSKENMQRDLQHLTQFNNRYYQSQTGVQSATWIQEQAQAAITAAGVTDGKVERFSHSFAQFSVIATIPGQSDETVVVGAHQDSINLRNPNGRAPGADDNGSGSVTILEAFRGILQDETIKSGNAPYTIEYHWYAGEEAGLLGSQDIFSQYRQSGKQIKGMLNQDMTGYIQGMLNNGMQESFGLMTDNSDSSLVSFVENVISEYCSIPAVSTSCGYGCSDHASATRNGYPAAMVAEAPMEMSDPYIHTDGDTMDYISFDHMLEHAKLVVGFTTELALGQ